MFTECSSSVVVTDRPGVEFPFAEGDGLIVEVKTAGLGLSTDRFFLAFEISWIQPGRERRAAGGILPIRLSL